MPSSIEKSIEVHAPIDAVYNQWTQFEEFPRFMEGVKEVKQMGATRLHWKAEVAGKLKEWDAEIVEQAPDSRIAWRSLSGTETSGDVVFQPTEAGTRVTLHLCYDPEGVIENVGDALGLVGRRIEGDLKRFRDFIEARGRETGAWRGEIHEAKVTAPSVP
jgi:uncharacterized membrane protein